MKKTQKTPQKEIELAEKRYADYISRAEGDQHEKV
jgi:phage-related protein